MPKKARISLPETLTSKKERVRYALNDFFTFVEEEIEVHEKNLRCFVKMPSDILPYIENELIENVMADKKHFPSETIDIDNEKQERALAKLLWKLVIEKIKNSEELPKL